MTRFIALFVITVACCISFNGQTPVASPPPADEKDVVKITTSLIQVDVTVTDRKGNVITDLKPEEIEIYENGEKQKITNFSFISNLQTRETAKDAPERNAPVQPPPAIRPEEVKRTIAVVVDDLTLSFESTHFVRRALKKFVDEQMQSGDLVAIIRTGAGMGALQQFTNDRRQLHAAIERVRWNPRGTGLMGAFAPLEPKMPSLLPEQAPAAGERTPEGIQSEYDDFRESLFTTGTLGAIDYIVRGMQELPGRKSILLMSDGFNLFSQDAFGTPESGRVMSSMRALVEAANRASVVIYTLDARGLQVTGLTVADSVAGWTRSQLIGAVSQRNHRLTDTQGGLHYLAEQTGGVSIVNNNDLSGGIRKILDDQSYYLIAYEPDDATFDPRKARFNKLDIKVTRPGAQVRYRSGFFGIPEEKITPASQTPRDRLLRALTSPFGRNEMSLHLNTLFYNSPTSGNVIRSLVHIRAQDLSFTDIPGDRKKAVFDLIAVGFGDNGIVVEETSKTFTIEISNRAFPGLMKSGFVYDLSFPIKKAGAYQLRVALRDHGSERLGSANQFVEVPNVKKGHLLLSGVVLENLPHAVWQKRESGEQIASNPLIDTAIRQFKRGTVLNYGFTIYNARGAGVAPNLSYQTRVFHEGKPIFESGVQPVAPGRSDSPNNISFSGALALGTEMEPGDYVVQVVLTDHLAKSKRNTASTFVQFEILE